MNIIIIQGEHFSADTPQPDIVISQKLFIFSKYNNEKQMTI